jgi:drug/metabolite transporter (DMT)-like permease
MLRLRSAQRQSVPRPAPGAASWRAASDSTPPLLARRVSLCNARCLSAPAHSPLFPAAVDAGDAGKGPAGAGASATAGGIRGQVGRMLADARFWAAWGVNQLGGLLFSTVVQASTPMSVASPACNGLALVFTAATAAALGERQRLSPRTLAGAALVLVGVALCTRAQMMTGGGDATADVEQAA